MVEEILLDLVLELRRMVSEQCTCERSGQHYGEFMMENFDKIQKKLEKRIDNRPRPNQTPT